MHRKTHLSLIAAAMLAAVFTATTASTSAATFTLTTIKCEGGTFLNFCYENASKEKLELEGEQALLTLSLGGKLKIPHIPLQINCPLHLSWSGNVVQTAPLKERFKVAFPFGLNFGECKINPEEKTLAEDCEIPTEIKTKEVSGELQSESELELKPKTGTILAEITFSNKAPKTCPATIKGTRDLTGSDMIQIENPGVAEESKKGKSILKSKLLFSEEPAELEDSLTFSFENEKGEFKLGDKIYISKVA